MRVSFEGILTGICLIALLGPVIAAVIRQVTGPAMRSFVVDGLSIQCFNDPRGIRVVCDERVVFATGKWAGTAKGAGDINGKSVAVRYWFAFPRLAIHVDGRRVTAWPFAPADWWARFLAIGWPALCMLAIAALVICETTGVTTIFAK